MARASWQGYITLGRLGIPVSLYSATADDNLKFTRLYKGDKSPVKRVLRSKSNKDIKLEDTIRAVEYPKGKFITLTDQELDKVAPNPVKTIDIKQFADIDVVNPIYYQKPYYVVARAGGERAYALIREVFAKVKKMAVVQFVLHGKEHLGTLTVHGDLLVIQQLRFTNQILPRSNIKTPALPKPSPKETDIFSEVVQRFSSPFYPEDYHDEYTDNVMDLVERKSKGLKPSNRKQVSPHATPEDKILPTLEQQLEDKSPPELNPGS